MGVAPHATPSEGGGFIVLKDTAANLEVLLPQLTQAQLASFTSIEISDSGILDLDPSTFTRLDKAVHVLPWTNNIGISLKNSNGADVSIRLVADQLSDLSSEKLLYNGEFVDKVSGSAGQNLVGLVDHIVIRNVNADDSSTVKTLSDQVSQSSTLISLTATSKISSVTADDFIKIVDSGATFPENVIIKDNPDKIEDVLSSTSKKVISALNTSVKGLESTETGAIIKLDWDQYVEITGGNYTTNPFASLNKIELVVSGTASELQKLFSRFGSDFSSLQNSISFKVTDGGEVTLNVAQADKLDGRFTGGLLIKDTSSAINSMLKEAVSENVKDISTTDSLLSLEVDQFRNLPAYNNDDVVIFDTEENILKALSFDIFDDRVSTLNPKAAIAPDSINSKLQNLLTSM